MFSFFAIAGLIPVLASIIWLQRHLPAASKRRARVQAGIATGVLAAVLSIGFACDNPEDAIANSGPAQAWTGDDPGTAAYLGFAPPGSEACLNQIVNEAWSKEIPQGFVAVTFHMGLRDYKGFVREAEWHRTVDVKTHTSAGSTQTPSSFIRPMTSAEEGGPDTKFSFENSPLADEENGP
jgi:hypothetical protein